MVLRSNVRMIYKLRVQNASVLFLKDAVYKNALYGRGCGLPRDCTLMSMGASRTMQRCGAYSANILRFPLCECSIKEIRTVQYSQTPTTVYSRV